MENAKFDDAQSEKKNFVVVQQTFKKMKGLNNELLPEYVKLMRQVITFMQTPVYANFYANYDRKLSKNLVKRCFLEPFSDKFLKTDESTFELARFKTYPNIFATLNDIFKDLDERNMLSESQKSELKPYLETYLAFMENEPLLQATMTPVQMLQVRTILTKCKYAAADELDMNNMVAIDKLFSQKKLPKMSRYINEIVALTQRLHNNKKLMKKTFVDKSKYWLFVKDNVEWMLEKSGYDFTDDEVLSLLTFLAKHSKNIVKLNKEFAVTMDKLLKKFIEA